GSGSSLSSPGSSSAFAVSSSSTTSSTSSSSGFCSSSCLRICCSSSVGTCRSLSACCRRGVMISCVVSRCERLCFISMAGILARSQAELLPEIETPCLGVGRQLVRRALHQDLSLIHDVGAAGHAQCLPHIVVRDQDAEAALAQPGHDLLDLRHG